MKQRLVTYRAFWLAALLALLAGMFVPAVGAFAQTDEPPATKQEVSTSHQKTFTSNASTGDQDAFYTDAGPRPDWVKRGDYVDSENQTRYYVVASDPRLKQREAEEELQERLVSVVREKVDDRFAAGAGKAIGIDLGYIRENLIEHHEECLDSGIYYQLLHWKVPEANQEMLNSEVREAYQGFAHIRMDQDFENWAAAQWENQLVMSRTMQSGLIALTTLLVLGVVFGYCMANHKTRGFYSRRLQTVSILFLLVAVTVIAWLATRFAWL